MTEAQTPPSPELYYILDTRAAVGNCCMWWGPDGVGYTCELDKAGLFTREDAERIVDNRVTDVAYPKEAVDALVVRHVRLDHLREQRLDLRRKSP